MTADLQALVEQVWLNPNENQLTIALVAAILGCVCWALNKCGQLGFKVSLGALVLLWKGAACLVRVCTPAPYQWSEYGKQLLGGLNWNPAFRRQAAAGSLLLEDILECERLVVNLSRGTVEVKDDLQLQRPDKSALDHLPRRERVELLKLAGEIARGLCAKYDESDKAAIGRHACGTTTPAQPRRAAGMPAARAS